MGDVVDIFGLCEAERCKRIERIITSETDLTIVNGKKYHSGCEPTEAEQEIASRSYT